MLSPAPGPADSDDDQVDGALAGMAKIDGAGTGFATGGGEPYHRLLQDRRRGTLELRHPAGTGTQAVWSMDLLRGPADAHDLAALDATRGPLLDVGCGPGRMVRAAAGLALPALGIDVSPAAIELAIADGTSALNRSIFDPLPLEGRWRTILLIDGNVGIGGDPDALFARCFELLRPGGVLVAEADADAELDASAMFTVVDDLGLESDPFPWARLGAAAIVRRSRVVGFGPVEHIVTGGRHFVRATRPRAMSPVTTAPADRASAADHSTISAVP